MKCRGIDNEVLRYDCEEVELEYKDEVYSENDISIGKYVKDKVDTTVEL